MTRTLKDKTLFISGAAAASAWRSRFARRATARTSRCSPRPASRIPSWRAPSHGGRGDRGGRRPGAADRRRHPRRGSVEAAVAAAVERFGGIDILVNNACAINLSGTEALDIKRYDLMQDINTRGTFVVSRACIPTCDERRTRTS